MGKQGKGLLGRAGGWGTRRGRGEEEEEARRVVPLTDVQGALVYTTVS